MPSNSPVARRCRAYRQRRRNGAVVVKVEIDADVQQALLDNHLLDPDRPLDRAALADGIGALLGFLKDGKLVAVAD